MKKIRFTFDNEAQLIGYMDIATAMIFSEQMESVVKFEAFNLKVPRNGLASNSESENYYLDRSTGNLRFLSRKPRERRNDNDSREQDREE